MILRSAPSLVPVALLVLFLLPQFFEISSSPSSPFTSAQTLTLSSSSTSVLTAASMSDPINCILDKARAYIYCGTDSSSYRNAVKISASPLAYSAKTTTASAYMHSCALYEPVTGTPKLLCKMAGGNVNVYYTSSMSSVGSVSVSMATSDHVGITVSGAYAFFPNDQGSTPAQMVKISISSLSVTTTGSFNGGAYCRQGFAGGGYIFTVSATTGTVSRLTTSLTLAGTLTETGLKTINSWSTWAYDETNNYLYISGFTGSCVMKFSSTSSSFARIATVSIGSGFMTLGLAPMGDYIVVGIKSSNEFKLIRTSTMTVISSSATVSASGAISACILNNGVVYGFQSGGRSIYTMNLNGMQTSAAPTTTTTSTTTTTTTPTTTTTTTTPTTTTTTSTTTTTPTTTTTTTTPTTTTTTTPTTTTTTTTPTTTTTTSTTTTTPTTTTSTTTTTPTTTTTTTTPTTTTTSTSTTTTTPTTTTTTTTPTTTTTTSTTTTTPTTTTSTTTTEKPTTTTTSTTTTEEPTTTSTSTSTTTSTTTTTEEPTTTSTTTTTEEPTTSTSTSTSTSTTTEEPTTSTSTSTTTTTAEPTTSSTTTTTTEEPTTTSTSTTTTTEEPTTSSSTTTSTTTTTTTLEPPTTTTTTLPPRTKTRTISKTILIPPAPTLAPPLPVAEEAAVATTTTVAATLSAPAAAQTLRSMSVLGVIDTKERCILSQEQTSQKDEFAAADRQFPESFVPQLKISYGDEKIEEKYGLASRRGAIIANTIIGPLIVVCVTMLIGFARTKVSPGFEEYGILAGGRTPSLLAAVLGALLMDGIFASAIVLMTVKEGPNGGDIALALFGIITSVVVVIIPGYVLTREMKEAEFSKRPIECVPAVVRSKEDPEGTRAAGFYWFMFGNEIWTGPPAQLEKFRALFATCRGMSEQYEMEFTKRKKFRRFLSTWSFYIDIAFTVIAAGGRGWATTDPCIANKKVQWMQFFISLFAFLFTVTIQPPISPMRRAADISANFLLVLSTFILAVLGAEAGDLVGKCALGAAFLATCSTIFLFVCRRIILPLKGKQICSKNSVTHAPTINDEIDLADLLALPLLGDGEIERIDDNNHTQNHRRNLAAPSSSFDPDAELKSFLSSPSVTSSSSAAAATATATAITNDLDLNEFLLPPTSSSSTNNRRRQPSVPRTDENENDHQFLSNLEQVLSGENYEQQQQENYDIDVDAMNNFMNTTNVTEEVGYAEDDVWANFDEDVQNLDDES